MKNTLDALHWRYATKVYDTNKKLSSDQVNFLLETVRLSPSSFGLQPYKIIHVTNPELREKLKQASWEQSQITDASELFVFAVPTNLNDTHVDDFIQNTATTRKIPIEQLSEYAGMIKGSLNSKDEQTKINWAAKQAYIALGILLESASLEQVDATPMEGFDSEQYDEILGLKDLNLTSVVITVVGYRSENDSYADLAKVRIDTKDLVIEM